jgi:hypothetical protein
MLMAGASPNMSAAKRFQATMRSNNPGIVPDREGTARTLEAARRWQQSMRMRDPGIVGNATSELSKALVRSAPSEIATRAAGDMVKRESGDIARRGAGELVKREAGDIAKRGAGELVKRGAGEIATRGSGEMVKRGAGELAKRGAGELAKVAASEGGKAGMRQIAGQVAKAAATSAASGVLGGVGGSLAMNAAKAVLPLVAVGAAQKGAGEFPELEKLRREESENRRVKMQQGMKTGMGNTAPGAYRHETHMTGLKGEYKPIEDLTGYAVDLIRRGKNFGEARKLMQGTEKFRGMSDDMKRMALQYYDTWQKNQLAATNPAGRAKLDAYLASEKKARMDAQKPSPVESMQRGVSNARTAIRRTIGME